MPTGGLDVAALTAFVGSDVAAGLGTAALGAELGGAVGFGSDLIEGKGLDKSLIGGLEGAGAGGITGGAIGFGPEIGGALGIGSTAGSALAGAAGGALGQAVTGGNPLTGAAEGGVAGGISGALSGTSSGTPSGSVNPVSGGSATTPAAPAGVAGSGDATSGLQTFNEYPGGPTGSTTLNTASGDALGVTGGSPADAGSAPSSTSLSGGNSTSISGGDSTSLSGGNSTPISGGDSTSLSGGSTAPISGGNSTPISGGNSTPLSSSPGGNISGSGGGNLSGAQPGNSITTALKDPSFSNIGTALGKNAGVLTSLAGLGTDIAGGMTTPKGESQLLTEADNLKNLGAQNEGYLASGTLPAGAQAGINQATQAAIAAIKSKYASMGMSGSSAEQADIQAATTNAQIQGTNIAMQLMQQGASETGMSSQIYSEIMNNAMKSDQNFSSAFTNLASAVGGGTSK